MNRRLFRSTAVAAVLLAAAPLDDARSPAPTRPALVAAALPANVPPRADCISIFGSQILVRTADGAVLVGSPYGTLAPIAGIADAVAVKSGGRYALVLTADGSLYGWGRNVGGIFGDPARVGESVSMPVRIDGIGKVAALTRYGANLVVLQDGTIRQLGTRSKQIGGISSAVSVANAGAAFFALLADGSTRAWGSNWMGGGANHGILGIGHHRDAEQPTPVVGVSNAIALVAGHSGGTTSGSIGGTQIEGASAMAAVLFADGTVKSWGGNQAEYADNDEANSRMPAAVKSVQGAVAITPWLALFPDGTVKEWSNPRQPVQAVVGLTSAVAIAGGHIDAPEGLTPGRTAARKAGHRRNAALLADGRLVMWWHGSRTEADRIVYAQLGPEDAQACAAPKKLVPPGGQPALQAPLTSFPETVRGSDKPPAPDPYKDVKDPSRVPTWSGTIVAEKGFPDAHSAVKEIYRADVMFEIPEISHNLAKRAGKHPGAELTGTYRLRPGTSKIRWEITGKDEYGCSYQAGPLTAELQREDAELTTMFLPGTSAFKLTGGTIQIRRGPHAMPVVAELVVSCPNGLTLTNQLWVKGPWIRWIRPSGDIWAKTTSTDLLAGSGGRAGERYTWNLTLRRPATVSSSR